MEFIQDDYEDILYWVDKQIDYYYLSSIQPSYITKKKMDKVSSFQSRKFQHHLNDNNTTTTTIHLLILKKKSKLIN
jgi:hypothetical protein